MNGSQTKEAPLAWSQTGEPIELPANAALWRVRRQTGNGRGGAPELVYAPDGLPLVVDITISAADFADAVERRAGKYRLEPLDESRKAIQGVSAAYVVVAATAAGRPEVPDGAPDEIAIKTLADVFMRQSLHVNTLIEACAKLVTAVDAAGVSRREPPPAAVACEHARRNGVVLDDSEVDEDDIDEDDVAAPPPAWLQQATHFCAKVPAENLRALGQVAPDLLANGIRKVIRDGIVSGVFGAPEGDEKRGGS
jgi:hypothetical protein